MWILLATSLFTAGVNRNAGIVLLVLSAIWAAWSGGVEPFGLWVMVGVAVISLLLNRYRHLPAIAISAELLLLLIALTLLSHFVPGFNHQNVLNKVRAGAQSAPFTMCYHFDKALIPFVLLAILPTLFSCKPLRRSRPYYWLLLIAALPLLLLLATAAGGLKLELHYPTWFWQFALANLFFVSLAEEALFRGYLQRRLSQLIGPVNGLLISALLFGISHLAGGTLLVVFATLAGVIYGLAWMWTGSLWVAALFHFALNLLHLLFFTYPAYQPA
ncbi:CPBP family intramembrane glutamic endopeptidase [Winslowiella iniecta]|uniref:CAAX protease n=1 Tax=Winslowiella iniecta TaxID=1560201 RepID=A0A0L7TIN7_9GAMM|nr:CPBP family intramembrane glutamic endopeptidase [Winslowiella iniecta]KOC92879.1 CAAX protease [Winslowiella iniecta]KOC95204.1 CAAX protease [Winslowiella iniecta]